MDSEYYVNEKRLAAFCLLHQITHIRVTFEGSGDSGSIDEIHFECPDEDIYGDDRMLTVWIDNDTKWNSATNLWESSDITEKTIPLIEFIRNHVYAALSNTGVDWYNNDGGFGAWEWAPKTGVEFNVYQREIRETCEYTEERRLGYAEDEKDEEAT